MKMRRSWVGAIVVALVVLGGGAASADPKGGQSQKITPALMALHAEHAAHLAQGRGLPFASANSLARVVGERVVIDAAASGDVLALKAALSSLGMRRIAVFGRVVSGELPIAAIPALDGIASLRFARPSYARHRAGSVTSQGDAAMRADVARATFGVSGAGVQVGVLSDSFNCLGGAPGDVASGDLSPVTVFQEISSCSGATDEGRAMLQIVHDVAPGASLAFATTAGGQAGVANNILGLRGIGARVLVDDVGYLNEPMFQDGIIAQAVDTVVGMGVAYFSAAGNDARQSYESVFRPGATFTDGQFPPSGPFGTHFFGGTAHNFAPSGAPDHLQRITIPSGATLLVTFQWDSPFFSVSGGAGSPNDVDIYLFNAAGDKVVAGSTDANIGGDPVEIFSFPNTGPTADFNLMIVHYTGAVGPPPGFIKYIQLGSSNITVQEFDTASGTVFGHPNAAGAMAVGAAFFAETPAFGVNPPLREPFSSSGPTPILFDTAGNRLGIIRLKPEIVAPDGVNTTFFDTPNFFGTSAAAPHAAGVAALLLESEPALDPGGIYGVLKATAIDMGAPGADFDTGFGLIQADSAIATLGITLANISTRGQVQTGDNIMIGGFIVEGNESKTVLVRARGPSLAAAPFFVPGVLSDPVLRLFSGAMQIAQNDDWQAQSACAPFACETAAQIQATGLDPCQPNPGQGSPPLGCELESVLLITLPPGAYTALVSGFNSAVGIGLVEVFDVDEFSDSKLTNISTRGRVQTGDSIMIGGFIVGGATPRTVLVRARGPSLAGAPFAVPGVLPNPVLRLFSGGTQIAQNDDWQAQSSCAPFACGTVAQIQATGLDPCQPNPGQATPPPGCALESVLLITLPPGPYTALLSGVSDAIGVALVEVFAIED